MCTTLTQLFEHFEYTYLAGADTGGSQGVPTHTNVAATSCHNTNNADAHLYNPLLQASSNPC
uniref:Uncharacterized protein n=1 Tax=Arundo donax TaxID=35708 RepID=A0A0A9D683_ARUDO